MDNRFHWVNTVFSKSIISILPLYFFLPLLFLLTHYAVLTSALTLSTLNRYRYLAKKTRTNCGIKLIVSIAFQNILLSILVTYLATYVSSITHKLRTLPTSLPLDPFPFSTPGALLSK